MCSAINTFGCFGHFQSLGKTNSTLDYKKLHTNQQQPQKSASPLATHFSHHHHHHQQPQPPPLAVPSSEQAIHHHLVCLSSGCRVGASECCESSHASGRRRYTPCRRRPALQKGDRETTQSMETVTCKMLRGADTCIKR